MEAEELLKAALLFCNDVSKTKTYSNRFPEAASLGSAIDDHLFATKQIETMTKKAKILKLFNDSPWFDSHEGRRKIITGSNFFDAGINFTIEYGENWSDIHYARRIIQELGYKVRVGMVFHVIDFNYQTKKH